jgi:hypothetical protein
LDGGVASSLIIFVFRELHHLPKSFETGVGVAPEMKRGGGEVGEQTEFVAFGKDDLSGAGFLGKDLPRGGAFFRNGCPPVDWILEVACGVRSNVPGLSRMTPTKQEEGEERRSDGKRRNPGGFIREHRGWG